MIKAWSRGICIFLFLVVLLACPFLGFSEQLDTVYVNQNTSALALDEKIYFFIDLQQKFDVDDVGKEELAKNIKDEYKPGYYNEGDLWFRFLLKSNSDTSNDFTLQVGGYNEIHVFYRKGNEEDFIEKITGRYIPYPINELGNNRFRNNKIQVQLEPDTPYEFIVFYPDPGWDKIKPELIISTTEKWLFNQAMRAKLGSTLLGIFFGVAIVLAFISLVYYFINWEKAYFLYSIYIFTIVYFEASRYGIVDSTFLIEFPILYFFLENIFLILTVVYYFLFLKSFLNTKERYPLWNKIVNALTFAFFIGLAICLFFIGILKQPLTAIEIRNYFLMLSLPFGIVFLVNLAIKGNKIDKIFLFGSFVLFSSGFISLVLDLYFKENKYPDLIFQIGVIIELTIFNIGLGVKSRSNEKEKQQTQLKLIEQLKENERLQLSINQELELQVNERTKEIQAQNEELLTQQEELAAHRDMLEGQNKIIAKSMDELKQIKSQLEDTVESRTQDLKYANQELVQRNNQLEQYAYITAHNLRAPVSRLKGLLHIFEKIGGITNEHEEVIQKISSSALEMDEVLTDMNKILELKNGNIQTSPVNINSIIQKVERILADSLHECNATIKTDLKVDEIHANEPYIESIIYNLISNAIKYRSLERNLEISISSARDNGQILLEVVDNGMGINLKKFNDKIFGLYQRFHDHVGGKGLGLYLVKTQVEALGGSIEIDSKESRGTKFTILFPV